jgi:oligopeptidase B
MVYEETAPGFFLDLDVTSSGDFVTIASSDHETSEIWLLDRKDPDATPRLVAAREEGLRYTVEHHGLDLIIRTNADGAEDFKIVAAPVGAPDRANWRDLVPSRPGTMVLFHLPFARHLVRLEREDAKPRIVIRELWTGAEHAIAFDEDVYALSINPGFEFDTDHTALHLLVPDHPDRGL